MKLGKSKRAQQPPSGGSAAALVAIITALIVLYIVFLPVSERDKLLEGSSSSGGTGTQYNSAKYNATLLEVHPGQMDYLSNDKIEHLLPSLNLVTKTEGRILEEESSMYVKSSVFSEKTASLGLTIPELDNAESVMLNFLVKDSQGRLIIGINGREVFNSEIPGTNIEPIALKKKDLMNINTITFSASSPGIAFWKTNEHLLEKITITADVTDTQGHKSVSIFIVDDEEINNLDKIKIKFVPDCDPGKVGVLSVRLNGNTAFSGIPDCGTPFVQEYAKFYLIQGENKLEFSTDKGAYLIDRIQVDSLLKEPRNFVYDFWLNNSFYQDIKNGQAEVNLIFDFIDYENDKEAEVIINGHRTLLSTGRKSYSRIINTFINQDFNYVKIIPKKKMYVATISVAVKKD